MKLVCRKPINVLLAWLSHYKYTLLPLLSTVHDLCSPTVCSSWTLFNEHLQATPQCIHTHTIYTYIAYVPYLTHKAVYIYNYVLSDDVYIYIMRSDIWHITYNTMQRQCIHLCTYWSAAAPIREALISE